MSHFFKSAALYRLADGFRPSAEELATALARLPSTPCGAFDLVSRGFAPEVLDANGALFFALATEEKLLPAAVVNQATKERAAEITGQQDHPVGRKQMKEIKEQVTEDLLPKAFTQRKTTRAYLDSAGWLVVEGTPAKAETLLECLHKACETLPVRRLDTLIAPVAGMADWLASGEAPAGFTIDQDAELQACDEGKAAIRYTRHSLDGEDLRQHLATGKLPTKLALTWADKISFVLTAEGHLKRLALLAVLTERAEANAQGAEEERLVSATLFAGELRQLLADLVAALGGEVTP